MNKQTQQTMFSSKSTGWSTPQDFFDHLDQQFGPFTLDPCATEQNYKVKNYLTEKDNGLEQSWEGHTVFMNPPYGREIKHWIKKAYEEGQKDNTTVVALLPARTDTKYWHEYVMKADCVFFLKGRLKFGGCDNSAPFPSAIVVFRKTFHDFPRVSTME